MKETFKEPLETRISMLILFGCLTLMWLFSDYPWISIIVGTLIYFSVGSKHYYLTFTDTGVEVIYPLIKSKSFTIPISEVEAVYHLILHRHSFRKGYFDLIRVNTHDKEYKISIERDSEDFRKINELIHHKNWGPLVRTKGDASNIKDVVKDREQGWEK